MATSQNGWSANDITQTSVELIPGTQRKLRLRKGDAGWLLRRIASFVDQHVENIDESVQDDWGYAERPIRGSATELSNHASGTAEDLNATQHQLGVTNSWSAAEMNAIHAHLREYVDPATGKNVIRWGQDYSNRKDGMHFEIVGSPAAVARVAAKLRNAAPAPVGNTPAKDVTIHIWSIQNGCGQKGNKAPAMRTSDEAYGDCRAFVAWARAKGFVTPEQENGWVGTVTGHAPNRENPITIDFEYGARILTDIVRRVQRANGLAADGVFGPQTGAIMAKSGYKIV
jgi:hypothetical protein